MMLDSPWYCIRCKPKQEHIAAKSLSLHPEIASFCPRMRYRKSTSRGPVWFVDAIFPGYIFAKFDAAEHLRLVRQTFGVADVVHFGNIIATLPDSAIEVIRKQMHGQEMVVLSNPTAAGESAKVLDGPFKGLDVVVSRFMPSGKRVSILMDLLGRTVEAEVKLSNLASSNFNPLAA
jgi:transcriptional antiterminator RfaH